MQKYLDILMGLDKSTIGLLIAVPIFLFILFGFFLSKDRAETTFWQKLLSLGVMVGGLGAFCAFGYAGLMFGKTTGIGGYGIVISLALFWIIGVVVQKMKARKRNRLINERFQKSVIK